jgi:polyphosphate glucokinase
MELGHLPYKAGTYEDYLGIRGLKKHGKKKWRKHVADVVNLFVAALQPDDVVLGGGNVNKLAVLPADCRMGDNTKAFAGGLRLWKESGTRRSSARVGGRPGKSKGTRVAAGKKTKGLRARR